MKLEIRARDRRGSSCVMPGDCAIEREWFDGQSWSVECLGSSVAGISVGSTVPGADVDWVQFVDPTFEGAAADAPFGAEFRGGQFAGGAQSAHGLHVELQALGDIRGSQQKRLRRVAWVGGWIHGCSSFRTSELY